MNDRTKKILAHVGSFVLAGVLLYFALRGVDFSEVGEALREADYWWLGPLVVITLLSHLLRAWRWQILLEALPIENPTDDPKRISLKTGFYSLMIGYMVNYAAPRAGEIARSVNLANQEKLRFSSVFGTVAIERILDVIVLGLAILSVIVLMLDRFTILERLFIRPIIAEIERIPVLGLVGILLALLLMVWGGYRLLARHRKAGTAPWVKRLEIALLSFKEGMLTLVRTPRRLALLFSTVAMWFCYMLMAYLPLVILGMHQTFGLTLLDAWVVMVLGAVGIAIPSPGGTGSYHYLTIETLVHLFNVARAPAASYAILAHGGQLVLYVIVGILCLLLQGTNINSLKVSSTEKVI